MAGDASPSLTSESVTTTTFDAAASAACETTIPVGGVLSFGPGLPVTTLTHAAVLGTPCGSTQAPSPTLDPVPVVLSHNGLSDNFNAESLEGGPQFSDFRDPFYASTFPVCYVLAATTVTAYMLVIMLFITPRSFLDGGIVYLGRRGFTNSSSGGISIGGRPWLQKVAAMTVAISLTIATADTFRVAQEQYAWGVQNADKLQVEVMDSTELKVIRLVSDTFLWLAQAQTLIRLFPRQREKVIIKWTAFALITLQVIFSALNSFYYNQSGSQGNARPQSFVDAVPTMSYLFHLSLGFLYAAWVIYYSLMKKRYAFYHPLMKNMVLVSALSLFSILLPIVFFILDISRPEFIGWGDYVRWVGAAAASVVVWEWVERIEALEREEKKDGILGREVFEGDEMMMEASASEFPWLRRRKNRKGDQGDGSGSSDGGGGGGQGSSTAARLMNWPGLSSIPSGQQGNYEQRQQADDDQGRDQEEVIGATQAPVSNGSVTRPPLWPSRPPPAVTPMSRTDTASAASTDYAVRYQAISDTTGRTPEIPQQNRTTLSPRQSVSSLGSETESSSGNRESQDDRPSVAAPVPRQPANATVIDPEAQSAAREGRSRWRTLTANPFRRQEDDLDLSAAAPHASPSSSPPPPPPPRRTSSRNRDGYEGSNRWDLRARLEDFAATQAEKIREKMQPTPETDSLPVTVVPAPPRQGAALAQLLEEEAAEAGRQDTETNSSGNARAAGPPLDRSASEASTFSAFPGFGARSEARLDRTTSNGWTDGSPGASQSTDSPAPLHPNQPPLWPGVQAPVVPVPYYDHDHDHEEAIDDQSQQAWTPGLHPRRAADDNTTRPPTP